MSAEVVQCPSCGGETRVPEALFGKAVKCPLCGTTYVAPVFEDGIAVRGATVAPTVSERRGRGRYQRDERRDRNTNQVVGLAMLLVGFVSLLVNGYSVTTILTDPDQAKANHATMMKQVTEALQMPEQTPAELEKGFQTTILLQWVFTGVALVIVAGAVCILARRFYPIACLSTAVAMLNFSNCCCLMGLPIGIWTLVVLLNPDVRDLYRSRGPAADPDSRSAGVGDL